MRGLNPLLIVMVLALLITGSAFADNAPLVTKMGNTTIINSGPTTVTKLGRTTIINSPNSDVNFTIPRGSSVYFPNYVPYNSNTWYYTPQTSVPSVYTGQHYCNAYSCY